MLVIKDNPCSRRTILAVQTITIQALPFLSAHCGITHTGVNNREELVRHWELVSQLGVIVA